MNACPAIGDHLYFVGNLVVGPCTGIVRAIYPTTEWIGYDCPTDKLLPESEWQVGFKVDDKPKLWSYTDADGFAPCVSELQLIAQPLDNCIKTAIIKIWEMFNFQRTENAKSYFTC